MPDDSDAPVDLEDHLLLNRRTYPKDFFPTYQRLGIEPVQLIQFPVVLPFLIPFTDGTCLSFQLDDAEACTLTFESVTTHDHVYAGVVDTKPIVVPHHRSRVEMTYVAAADHVVALSEETLSQVFDTLLAQLNSVVAAYMVVVKDYRVHRLSKEMFEFGSVYRVVEPRTWTSSVGLFLLHWQFPFEKPEMSDEHLERVVWFSSVIDRGLNPFILTEEFALSARREFLTGAYREAVIYAQTAVETMLATLLAQLMLVEGSSQDDVDRMMETGFIPRVCREYHQRLGGEWDPLKAGTAVGDWYSSTYSLRNRVVHAGVLPSHGETSAAVDAAAELIRYVVGRVKDRAGRYPSLQPYFAGPPMNSRDDRQQECPGYSSGDRRSG